MLVRANGSSEGTIGGGRVEGHVIEETRRVIEVGQAKMLKFELTAKDLAEDGSICGGNVTIFVEPLPAGVSDLLEIYRKAVRIRRRGGNSALATIISVNDTYSRGENCKALIDPDGQFVGSLLDDPGLIERLRPEIAPVLREDRTMIHTLQRADEKIEVLLEPILSEPTVFIFGCGHISTCLAPLTKTVGFRVVVADDRADFANQERFSSADEVVLDAFEGLLEKLGIDENSYLIVVTRGHLHDLVVLEQALVTPARYIGMIGSGRKIRMVFDNLREKGVSEDLLSRVHAPIGLDIGAETPEEIAVSILAELIEVRAGKG
jgi:xanthine dehydrogenase accessory factor